MNWLQHNVQSVMWERKCEKDELSKSNLNVTKSNDWIGKHLKWTYTRIEAIVFEGMDFVWKRAPRAKSS